MACRLLAGPLQVMVHKWGEYSPAVEASSVMVAVRVEMGSMLGKPVGVATARVATVRLHRQHNNTLDELNG